MQDTKKKVPIWNTVKPFYWILRAFGLAVFSIDGKISSGKIKTSFHNIVHFLVVLSVQFYVLYLNLKEDFSLSRTNSFLIDKGLLTNESFFAKFDKIESFQVPISLKSSTLLMLFLELVCTRFTERKSGEV